MEFSRNNWKNEFTLAVDNLLNLKINSIEKKKQLIDELTSTFIQQIGKRPPNADLERLADWLLEGELKDKNPYKTRKNEYPILSESQQKRRNDREVGGEGWDNLFYSSPKHDE